MTFKEWQEVEIQSLCDIKRGASPRPIQNYLSSTGIPWVKISDATSDNSRFLRETKEFIKEEGKPKSRFIEKGTLILSNSATPGIPKIMNIDACVHDGWLIIDNFKNVIKEFMYYLLIYNRERLLSLSNGSVFRNLKTDIVKEYKVRIPSIQEQKCISKILLDIDNKIDVNNKINKNLEEMAQAIFKQWFIDFEFPCIPENYKFSGAGKPRNFESTDKPKDFDKVCTYKRVGGLPIPDGDSWFVYVLLCEDGSFYKGITKDLYRRFYEHYTGIGAEWTKTHKPVKVIHYEKFNTQEEARKREEELKLGYGREWIKREYKKYIDRLSIQEVNAGSPAHQTRLVPAGEMVESEFGMIPKEWRVSNLDEVLTTIEAGNRPKGGSGNLTEGIPSIGAENIIGLGQYDYSKEKYVTVDYFNKMKKGVVKCKDVLLYKDGAQLGRKTFFMDGFPHNKCCINSHVFILRGNESITQEYLYLWLDQYEMIEKIKNLNANSAQPGINQTQVKTLPILVPNKDIIDKFTKIIESLFKVIFNNCKENKKNTELLDTLLPKLMSGEIRVNID